MNSNLINTDTLLTQLNWRYATKKFDPARKIPAAQWAALEQSLVLTPSSFGLQPWKFIVVNDPKLREQLVAQSWNQRQVADASHLVVFAVKKAMSATDVDRFIQRTADVRGTPLASLDGFKQMLNGFLANPKLDVQSWATRQAYIALGQLLTSAALLGLDACPMEGIEPTGYDEAFGLAAQGFTSVVVCSVGYRAADDKYASLPKVRFPASEIVAHVE